MRYIGLLLVLIVLSANCDGFQETGITGDTQNRREIDAAIRQGNSSIAWEQFKQLAVIASSSDEDYQLSILDQGIDICLLANNPQLANDLLRPSRRMALLRSDYLRTRGLIRKAAIHFVSAEYREMNDTLNTASDLIDEHTSASDLALLFAYKGIHAWMTNQHVTARQFIEEALRGTDENENSESRAIGLLVLAFLADQNPDPQLTREYLDLSRRNFESTTGAVACHALLVRLLEFYTGDSIHSVDNTILQFAANADRYDIYWLQAKGLFIRAELLRREGEFAEAMDFLEQSLILTGLAKRELEQWKLEWERISPLLYRPPFNDRQTYSIYLLILSLLLVVFMLVLLLRIRTQRIINQRLVDSVEKSRIAEQAAEHASELRKQFVANVSHEIKTPMSGLVGMTSLLEELITDPKQRKYLATIRACSRNLMVLLDDLLDLARIEANKLEIDSKPFPIEETLSYCEEVVRLNALDKGLHLIVDIDPNLPEVVIGDPTRISQIVVNLLNNAIKFTEKGSVRLSVKFDPATAEYGQLLVRVEDTGPGIEPDRLQTVFEPFNQYSAAKDKEGIGSGLGLAICKRLTDHMGGSLTVDSEPGRGSVFALFLPLKLPTDKLPALS